MRKFTLLFLMSIFIGLVTNAQSVFFSEYIEGGSQNKALELYNGTDAEVDLHNYVIRLNNNGNPWNGVFNFPEGTMLASGDVYVIAHEEADAAILAVADSVVLNPYSGGTSYVVSFNGNDARGLFEVVGTDTNIVDMFGILDDDSNFDVAGVSGAAKDHTLVRKDTVTSGETVWATSAGTDAATSGWIVNDKDDFSFLGWHINAPSNEAEILSFVLAEEIAPAMISSESAQVTSTVALGTDLTTLDPTITVSAGADIVATTLPVVFDGVNPVEYKVTAADGTEKLWSVMVQEAVVYDTTIYAIQFTEDASGDSPFKGGMVTTNGIVTGLNSKGFFLQDGAGAWNGVWVYSPDSVALVAVGDDVTLTGMVDEYYNLTEILDLTEVTVNSSDNTLPDAAVTTIPNVVEPFEGVLIKVETVSCAVVANDYGEWLVEDATPDTLVLDDDMFAYTPTLNEDFISVTGCLNFSYGAYKLLPRSADDIVSPAVPTVNVTFNVTVSDTLMVDGDVIYITGNFTGWAEPGKEGSFELTDADSDGIYTVTVEIAENYGEVQYKYFLNAGWDGGEWTGDPNRVVTVADVDVTFDDVWGVIVGVEDNKLDLVSMYPNPVNSQLYLDNLEGVSQVMVSNILGQSLFVQNVTETNITINTSDLETGVYIVTLITENGLTRSERIIKE